ncbi:hypothetical protein [Halomonas alkaliantarctica]|nr:hypothetical protein [Halomonas alkaliantarctica]
MPSPLVTTQFLFWMGGLPQWLAEKRDVVAAIAVRRFLGRLGTR